MIGLKTALGLYILLAIFAILKLHGMALALALIIIGGLAAKTLVDHLRRRLDRTDAG